MLKKYTFLILLLTGWLQVYAQDAYQVSGGIYDSLDREPLAGATITVKGTTTGTTTDAGGHFSLTTNAKIPFILLVTYLGYSSQEFTIADRSPGTLSLSLNPQQFISQQVVVTASRRPESFMKSPVTIEKLDIKAIKESPAPTFFDALESLKGVQMTTLSLMYKVPNTRGFSGTTNSRFLQMVDGVDNISPGIGAPVANAIGPSDLDIESVELIPGAASALYGLNAVNGISNMKTRSPFDYPGLSVAQKTGGNHINDPLQPARLFTETSVRYARVFKNRFAFKINADYAHGYDGIANNLRDQNPDANTSVNLTGSDNPGSDLINVYGDEGSNRKTLTLNGKNYSVSRTGYAEKDLADYHLRNLKADLGLYYKFGGDKQISYTYRIGRVSNLYQRGNRIQLDGLQIQQHSLEFKGDRFFVRAYYTRENTGNSYNLRPLGENIDKAFKSNDTWFNDYKTGYLGAIAGGQSDAAAQHAARAFADQGRYQPGTAAFEQKKQELIKINNWDQGAALIMNTAFAHLEGQYDFSTYTPGFQTLAGFNYRNYFIEPDGNSYVNPASYLDVSRTNTQFNYYSYGGFVQVTKLLFAEKLKLIGSLRADKVQYYSPKLNPRIAAVYTFAGDHNVRISYQNGFRFPTLFESFSYVDNGGIKRLGGLKVMSEYFGVIENSWLRSSQDAFIKAVNTDVNKNGLSQDAAILKNKDLLVKSNYGYIKPEQINSFEAGYKGSFLGGRLFVDADYYFNIYKDFIGQVELTRPNNGTIGANDSTIYAAYDKSQSKIYRMWTNSTSIVSNQGASLGISYAVYRKYQVSGNAAFATLVKVSEADALIPAFNTPKWMVNLSVGNNEVFKNAGFNLSWRWQSAFDWQSPLANGTIPAYATAGAQFSYRVPQLSTSIKLGATNLFNKRYYQYEGGPVIDGFYYVTLVYDPNFKKK